MTTRQQNSDNQCKQSREIEHGICRFNAREPMSFTLNAAHQCNFYCDIKSLVIWIDKVYSQPLNGCLLSGTGNTALSL